MRGILASATLALILAGGVMTFIASTASVEARQPRCQHGEEGEMFEDIC
jgi:hypothetical protein